MRRIWGRRVASAVAVLSIVVVAVPVVPGTVAAAATTAPTGPQVAARSGLATGPEILWESDADQNADYAAVAASGATWTTIDFDWNHIQSDGPSSWRWNAATDRAVLSARAHGLQIIAVAAYSPTWARRPDCPRGELHCFPAKASDYGRFLGAAAARYGSRATDPRLRGSVTVWSLWNEPNHEPFSMPEPDPDKYAAMVKSAYPAVKAADPTATVLTGGTAPAPDAADGSDYEPTTWLRMLYDRGAGGYFDGVAHHPYSYPTNPLEAHTWNAYTQTRAVYDVMVAHGDSAKKVWGTEAGAPTGTATRAVTETQQAKWVRDYFTGWNTTFRAFTGPLVLFRLRDSSTNISDLDDNFGLMRRDRSPKPVYRAFQDVMGATVNLWSAGTLGSAPAAVSWAPNRLDVFVADANGSLIHKWWDGRGWSFGWENLGRPSGGLATAPAAVSWAPNRLDVFAADANGSLIHKWWDGRAWSSGWENLGGPSGGLATAPATVSSGANRLDVFAADANGALIHQWWDGVQWNGWENLGGDLASAPTAAVSGPDRLDVFAWAPSGALVHRSWDGVSWSAWESLGGGVVGDPSVVSWGPNRLDVFVRGTDDRLHHRWYHGRWAGWESLGGVLTAGPTGAAWNSNRLDVFVRGSDGALWHRWWDGVQWRGFESLGRVF